MNRRDWLTALGAALAVPRSDDVLAMGRTLHARVSRGAPLQVLSPQQSELVATLAELILPETDTPGARAARVHEFIDLMLAERFDAADRDRFLAGLADVDTRAKARGAGDFLRAAAAQQLEVLTTLDDELAQERDADRAGVKWRGRAAAPDKNFFQRMKWLTLLGYYTSEIGFTQELRAQIIPGRYDGCVPLESRGS
jgi:hypothetical protein